MNKTDYETESVRIMRSVSREFFLLGAAAGFIAGFVGALVLQGVLS